MVFISNQVREQNIADYLKKELEGEPGFEIRSEGVPRGYMLMIVCPEDGPKLEPFDIVIDCSKRSREITLRVSNVIHAIRNRDLENVTWIIDQAKLFMKQTSLRS